MFQYTLRLALAVCLTGWLSGVALAEEKGKKNLIVEAKLATKEKNGTETVVSMPKATIEASTKADYSVDDGAKGVKVVMIAGTARTDAKHQIEVQMTEKGKDGKPNVIKFSKITVQTGKTASVSTTSGGTAYTFEVSVRPE